MSPKEIASMVASLKSKDAIYIWDGDAELSIRVTATDAATRAPVLGATVTLARDRRVGHSPNGRAYPNPSSASMDSRGHGTVRASFPAAGGAQGSCVFVCDSHVTVEAPGYRAFSARVSPIYRLDFPRGRKTYVVTIVAELTRV
jgi:hypothetical protein